MDAADSTALEHYREIVRLPTMSRLDPAEIDPHPFQDFVELLPRLYPALHAATELERVNGFALLYRWSGRSSERPSVLMAHYDVVGATEEGWSTPPFSAEIVGEGDDAAIVSRGVIDDKASLVGILEAADGLATTGFVPANDLYLAFSHNEEVLGDGTPGIVALLESRGVRPAMVLDEGGIVGESIFPGVGRDVVYVGVSEKGTATIRLSISAPGGHASVPPEHTATARIARAVVELDETASAGLPILSEVTRHMIATVGPYASGGFSRAAELLPDDEAGAIAAFASVSRDANAMVKSLPIVTMVHAGHTANAIPERATATVNIRVSPGHRALDLVDWVRERVSDPEIELELVEHHDPSPVSPWDDEVWRLLDEEIRAVYGEVLVVPYVNNGGTDSRNYTDISDHVYRFSPYRMTRAERGTLHAIDERLRISSFVEGLRFYRGLLPRL